MALASEGLPIGSRNSFKDSISGTARETHLAPMSEDWLLMGLSSVSHGSLMRISWEVRYNLMGVSRSDACYGRNIQLVPIRSLYPGLLWPDWTGTGGPGRRQLLTTCPSQKIQKNQKKNRNIWGKTYFLHGYHDFPKLTSTSWESSGFERSLAKTPRKIPISRTFLEYLKLHWRQAKGETHWTN